MALRIALAVTVMILPALAHGQAEPASPATAPAVPTPPPATVAPPAAEAPRTVVLRANALVPLRFMETVSSDIHHPGDMFRMEVTDDITVDDTVVIPAGSVAEGEVIHAQPAGMLGKAGELIVSARFVHVGEREIRLRSTLGNAGQSNIAGAFIVPFVRGKQATITANTEVVAKIAADETFTASAPKGN